MRAMAHLPGKMPILMSSTYLLFNFFANINVIITKQIITENLSLMLHYEAFRHKLNTIILA